MASRRHRARTISLKTLFALDARKDGMDPLELLSKLLSEERSEGNDVDADFATVLLEGVLEHQLELLAHIQRASREWSMSTIDPISKALLLIGTYELTQLRHATSAVVINEAVELAKEFGTQESAKFINGVLQSISKSTQEHASHA